MSAPTTRRRVLAVVGTWIIGFCIATAIIWVYGALCLSDLMPRAFDKAIDDWVPPAGVRYRLTSEGWGASIYNEHRIQGDLPKNNQPLCIFWGDSFVEGAGGVEPSEKMHAVFTDLGKQLNPPPVGIAIGSAGAGTPHIYSDMLRFHGVLPPARYNFYVVNPHNFTSAGEWKIPHPGPEAVIPSDPRRRFLNLVAALKANFISTVVIESNYRSQGMRFGIGPVTPRPGIDVDLVPVSDQELRRQIALLKSAADGPLVFILRPYLPQLRSGQIDYTDPRPAFAEQLRRACAEEGVGFVYDTERFRNFTRQTNQFPLGFSNTLPDQGHFNANGHRLIAESAIDYLLHHGFERR